MKVGVLGAGPTGLMAAADLADRGFDVVVFEAAGAVGGMAGSFEVADQRVDFGSHRLHGGAPPALLRRIRNLLGSDLQERPRSGRINLAGRWIGFPLTAGDLARRLPPRFAVGSALDTLRSPFRRPDPSNFQTAIQSGLGPTVARSFYGPYARKLYGVEPDELTAEVARRRVAASSPAAILRRLASARRDTPTFLYPRTGYGLIVERLAEAAIDDGARIALDTPVERIVPGNTGVAVTAGSDTRRFDHVVSTIPLPRLAHCLQAETLALVTRDAISTIRTRSMILVYLVVPRDQYTPFDAHYLPDDRHRVARLSEPKNYRDGPDPAGQTVLCAEIACWQTDELWRWNDEALGALVREELVTMGLPDPTPVHVETRRLASVYPVHETATQTARDTALAGTQALPGVTPTGRHGHAVFDNLHHVFAMGQAVAASFDEGGFSLSAWRSATAAFDDHVVED